LLAELVLADLYMLAISILMDNWSVLLAHKDPAVLQVLKDHRA
jgi:hypothetical protein